MSRRKPKVQTNTLSGGPNLRGAIVALAAFSLVLNVLMLTSPVYMLEVYDRVLVTQSVETLAVITLIALAMIAVIGVLEAVRSRVAARAATAWELWIGARAFEALSLRSLQAPHGARAQRLRDLDAVRNFISGRGLFALFDAPWAPLYLLVIWLVHPWLGYVALGGAVLLSALAWLNEIISRSAMQRAGSLRGQSADFAEMSLRNAETLHAMGMLSRARRLWEARRDAALAAQSEASDSGSVVTSISKATRIAVQSLSLGMGAFLVIQQEMSPGSMIAASVISGRALAPVEQLIASWRAIIDARAAHRRIRELVSTAPSNADRMELPAPTGRIDVENLVGAAPGASRASLRGVTFSLNPGESLGVIGPSGSGKTTLARLLIGVWKPLTGAVRIDGAEIGCWNADALGPHVGYMPQDVELFDGTVAQNIARFGEIDGAKVVDAARLADVHEMVLRMPDGYETNVGDGGAALSGGQRQRIGLARALYGRPRYIVLDEPNSSLDNEGDQALLRSLKALKDDAATVIIITHRPSMLRNVDRILLLSEGNVARLGPVSEMLSEYSAPKPAPEPEPEPKALPPKLVVAKALPPNRRQAPTALTMERARHA